MQVTLPLACDSIYAFIFKPCMGVGGFTLGHAQYILPPSRCSMIVNATPCRVGKEKDWLHGTETDVVMTWLATLFCQNRCGAPCKPHKPPESYIVHSNIVKIYYTIRNSTMHDTHPVTDFLSFHDLKYAHLQLGSSLQPALRGASYSK